MQILSTHRLSVNLNRNWRYRCRCWWRETRKLLLLTVAVTVALW